MVSSNPNTSRDEPKTVEEQKNDDVAPMEQVLVCILCGFLAVYSNFICSLTLLFWIRMIWPFLFQPLYVLLCSSMCRIYCLFLVLVSEETIAAFSVFLTQTLRLMIHLSRYYGFRISLFRRCTQQNREKKRQESEFFWTIKQLNCKISITRENL